MPRVPRLRVEGGFYHVYSRGNRRQLTFLDDLDRRRFLQRLRRVEIATGAVRVAHCLMPNHFHLLVRPGAGGISRFMHRVLGGYAAAFNRRHGVVGHLFQGRFGSRPLYCEDDILIVLKYIHHNPRKAGLVSALGDWEWSSHRAHAQEPPPPELAVGVRFVRGMLTWDRREGGRPFDAYLQLMDEPAPGDDEVYPRIVSPDPPRPVEAGTPPMEGSRLLSIPELVSEAARRHGVSRRELAGRSLRRILVHARRDLIQMAVLRCGRSAREMSEALGCSVQAVYRHLARGRVGRGDRPPPARVQPLPGLAMLSTTKR